MQRTIKWRRQALPELLLSFFLIFTPLHSADFTLSFMVRPNDQILPINSNAVLCIDHSDVGDQLCAS